MAYVKLKFTKNYLVMDAKFTNDFLIKVKIFYRVNSIRSYSK